MIKMKKCCDNYVLKSQPKKPQFAEFFEEIQTCPCGQKLKIRFQRIEFLGGEVQFVVLEAELL